MVPRGFQLQGYQRMPKFLKELGGYSATKNTLKMVEHGGKLATDIPALKNTEKPVFLYFWVGLPSIIYAVNHFRRRLRYLLFRLSVPTPLPSRQPLSANLCSRASNSPALGSSSRPGALPPSSLVGVFYPYKQNLTFMSCCARSLYGTCFVKFKIAIFFLIPSNSFFNTLPYSKIIYF